MFFNAFNFVFSVFYVTSASGANLLFSKQKYLAWNKLSEHGYLASGDDHFLLRNFQSEKAIITVSNEAEKSVNTYSVESWREYFIQRLRWLSKMKHKSNGWDKLLGLLFGTYFLGTFVVFIVLGIAGDFNKLIALIALRLLMDIMVFSHYAVKLNVFKTFWVYPLFFTFYPVVFCSIFLGALFYRPKWKGREVIKKE
jgi:hypothetical protein